MRRGLSSCRLMSVWLSVHFPFEFVRHDPFHAIKGSISDTDGLFQFGVKTSPFWTIPSYTCILKYSWFYPSWYIICWIVLWFYMIPLCWLDISLNFSYSATTFFHFVMWLDIIIESLHAYLIMLGILSVATALFISLDNSTRLSVWSLLVLLLIWPLIKLLELCCGFITTVQFYLRITSVVNPS